MAGENFKLECSSCFHSNRFMLNIRTKSNAITRRNKKRIDWKAPDENFLVCAYISNLQV